jgi:putative toxin-antitoxin system antitoxin component (TIGR02293 family)
MHRMTRQIASTRAQRGTAGKGRGGPPSIWRLCSAQLGRPVASESELLRCVTEAPLSIGVVPSLLRHGWRPDEVHATVIPKRTLAFRRSRGRTALTAEETDRAVRGARIVALAETVFGDREKALAWLRKPKAFLGGAVPMQVLALSEPTRLVEEKLLQLGHGLAA